MNRSGDMTPQMMVLGLVAVEGGKGATVVDTQRRLVDLFPSADFPKNAAHTNLPNLEEKGHVRLVERGVEATQNRYEITAAGIDRLREWVSSSPPPPAIREPVHGRVQFATIEDLKRLVPIVRSDEMACRAASDDARERIVAAQRRRLRFPPKTAQGELSVALSMIYLRDVALTWNDMADRRKILGDDLEKLAKRFSGAG